jgi:hypothetical protein
MEQKIRAQSESRRNFRKTHSTRMHGTKLVPNYGNALHCDHQFLGILPMHGQESLWVSRIPSVAFEFGGQRE